MEKYDDRIYKDKVRHGGHRERLLEIHGPRCSICGYEGEEFEIVAHHITGKPNEHDFQILLCRSCHASIHQRGVDKKTGITIDEIREAIESCKNLYEASDKVGLSRSGLYQRRKRYNIKKKCRFCKELFFPTKILLWYCSENCRALGIKQKTDERMERVTKEQKSERDKKSYLKHREKRIASCKEYYRANSEKIKQYAREYHRKKRLNKEAERSFGLCT